MSKDTLLSGEDLWSIRKTQRIIREFRKLHPDVTAGTIEAFLVIAQNPGIYIRTLGDRIGASGAGVSRYVAYLGAWDRRKQPGFGLIETQEDFHDRRYRHCYLTEKGKRVAEDISMILKGDQHDDKATG